MIDRATAVESRGGAACLFRFADSSLYFAHLISVTIDDQASNRVNQPREYR